MCWGFPTIRLLLCCLNFFWGDTDKHQLTYRGTKGRPNYDFTKVQLDTVSLFAFPREHRWGVLNRRIDPQPGPTPSWMVTSRNCMAVYFQLTFCFLYIPKSLTAEGREQRNNSWNLGWEALDPPFLLNRGRSVITTGLSTLAVVSRGKVHSTPSDPEEKHHTTSSFLPLCFLMTSCEGREQIVLQW